MRIAGQGLIPAKLTLLAAAGFAALWCVASLWFPLGWDQGMMASVGSVIVDGGMPYRDAFALKTPLAHLVFGISELLFGRNTVGIRIVDLLILLAGAFALYRCVARLCSPVLGVWAALLLVLWRASLTWFHQSQPEGWVAVLALLAAAPLIGRTSPASLGRLALSAILIGLCGLIKPVFALLLLLPLAHLYQTRREAAGRSLPRSVAVVVAASAIPLAMTLVWFAAKGALGSLIEVQVGYILGPYSSGLASGLVAGVKRVPIYLLTDKPAIVFPFALLGLAVLWRRERATGGLLALWLGVTLVVVAMQGKFFVYHWLPAFPPLIILAAAGLKSICALGERADADRAAIPVGALLAGVFLVTLFVPALAEGHRARGADPKTPVEDLGLWQRRVRGILDRDEFVRKFEKWAFVAGHDDAAARFIEDRTDESDGVTVFGNNATINFLSGRRNPSRFTFAMPLNRGGAGAFRDRFRAEYMADLKAVPPRYIVIGLSHSSPDRLAPVEAFPELERLIADDYRLETEIGLLELYRRVSH